jgi:hypothetical protein
MALIDSVLNLVTKQPEEILRKDELNGVIELILQDAKAA